jgi:hypothetical protein
MGVEIMFSKIRNMLYNHFYKYELEQNEYINKLNNRYRKEMC